MRRFGTALHARACRTLPGHRADPFRPPAGPFPAPGPTLPGRRPDRPGQIVTPSICSVCTDFAANGTATDFPLRYVSAYALYRPPPGRRRVPAAPRPTPSSPSPVSASASPSPRAWAVLDKGYAGHYPGTQRPGQAGNFALAGHRNTHGEPFRRIDRLRRGDVLEVETRGAVYTYAVDRTLPRTSARDGGVLRPVPRSTVRPAYGYPSPGYYIALTTCAPEYTSRCRLVVWGTLASMRPRG